MLAVPRSVKRLIAVIVLTFIVVTSAAAQATPIQTKAGEPLIDQIIVKYRATSAAHSLLKSSPEAELKRLSEAAATTLAYVREMSGDAHVVRLAQRQTVAEVAQVADRLAALPEIEYAVPDRVLHPLLTPNDAQYSNQWHYFDTYGIDAPAAWDITTGSANIVVAVIDTGILGHGDLAGRTVGGYDFITDSRIANDGTGRDADPSDPGDWITAAESSSGFFVGCDVSGSSWHGSHVAGTIGAASNNTLGVAGINWNSKILPVRVLGKCGGMDSDIIDGMRWAAGLPVAGVPNNPNPAKVINMSLGGSGACDAAQQAAINEIVAAGTTVVVAAGNSNADASGFSPASCNNVIAVAATNRTGNRSYYSNFGSVVDIAAPGGETTVTSNGVLSTLNAGTTSPGADSYAYYQGTSMASPHVAGVASLVVSLNPNLSPNQVSAILRGTVKAFPGGSTCNISICGTGIVNAFNAVNVLPRITSYSPTNVSAGSGNVTLVITGANFISGALVKWNGTTLATTFVNSTRVTAVVSSSLLTNAGVGNVTVSINNGSYGTLTTAAQSVVVKGGVSVFLPLVIKNWPQVPAAPALLAINNATQSNAYTVAWNGVSLATSYTLQEDDNAAFSSPVMAYNGANTSWNASSKPAGTYYYRVQAANSDGTSGWSATQSTAVGSNSIANGDFESGHSAWTEYSSHGWDTIVGSADLPTSVTPHGGSWATWLGGDYNDISYIQQQVTVPSIAPYLAYYHWIGSGDTCGNDLARVRINGTNVEVYNLCTSTSTGGWVKHVVNLSAYAGQSVALQIRVETNGSNNSNLFVDDVFFQATATAAPDDQPFLLSTSPSASASRKNR
ncbi:MAG: S8 family serine peptidase [Anaerolineae bacterium]